MSSSALKDSSPPPGATPSPAVAPTSASNNPNSPTSSQQQQQQQVNGERRTSFGFLRRQKSTDAGKMLKKQRGPSGAYNQQPNIPAVPPQLPTHSPLSRIPGFGGDNARPDSFQIATNSIPYRAGSGSYGGMYVPVPPIPTSPSGVKNGDHVDPYARTESMTHRGRYSYASSAISSGTGINSPRRVRRRKDPTPFNILVIGEQNSGKTSFIDFLRVALAEKSRKRDKTPSPPQTATPADSAFTPHYLETDIDHERIGVTLWDSQGLEKKFVDLQLREMSSFLESKFEETFTEEQKVVRAPGVRDTHIHCVFLILDPTRLNANLVSTRKAKQTSSLDEPARLIGALDEDLDIQVLKTLQGKTTVIPVISKADTITTTHMALLKKSVWNSLKQAKLDPLEALNVDDESEDDGSFDEREEDAYLHGEDGPLPAETSQGDNSEVIDNLVDRSTDDEDDHDDDVPLRSTPPTSPPRSSNNKDAVKAHRRSMSDALSAIGAADEIPFLPMSIISPDSYEPGIVGRRFPWGFADPYNTEHCDFVRLKDAVFSEWRAELREASREVWYEGWRTSRLRKRDRTPVSGGAVQAAATSNGYGRKTMVAPGSSPTMVRGYGQGVAF